MKLLFNCIELGVCCPRYLLEIYLSTLRRSCTPFCRGQCFRQSAIINNNESYQRMSAASGTLELLFKTKNISIDFRFRWEYLLESKVESISTTIATATVQRRRGLSESTSTANKFA